MSKTERDRTMQDKASSDELIWEVKGPVGIVTFNRPRRTTR